jgi:MoxR-like ATPase
MRLTRKQTAFLDQMISHGVVVHRDDKYDRQTLVDVATANGMKHPPAWITQDAARKTDERGVYSVPEYRLMVEETPDPDFGTVNGSSPEPVQQEAAVPATSMALAAAMTAGERTSLIPDVMGDFVAWGHSRHITQIISSGFFAPVFVTGLSGNGKTTMIEQACAKAKRECYRVNITQETDEDDLLGGFRLINGNTVFSYGPVVEAMRNGAVLLLDEIDLASSKIMCLQPVLEGKGVFVKKIGEWITPAPGFTVLATANTKGKGDVDGRFIGTNVLNEAFLDRFDWTMEQDYAPRATETRIIKKKMEKYGQVDEDFADYLTRWAEITRKAYTEGAIDEIITTRRLENICKAFAIFKDRKTSVALALARFDADTQQAFWSLYEKVDETIREEALDPQPVTEDTQESVGEYAVNA